MRTFAILLISNAVAYCFEPLSSNQLQQWEEYKLEYGKNYDSVEEETLRQQIFFDTLDMIEEHNKKYEAGLETYTKGINQFADMTKEEFKKNYLLPFNLLDIPMNLTLYSPPPGFRAPEQLDWRQRGAVTRVKNQGNCGSCWAFSTTGVLESQLKIKLGKSVTLSEQQLVDCDKTNYGCKGGYPSQALQYIAKNGGINPDSSYRYEGVERQCRYNPHNIAGTVKSVRSVPSDPESLKKAVARVGPISVGINGEGTQHYQGGILQHCPSKAITHVVLLVGYGTEGSTPYWILKNSWGTQYGESGYLRVLRDTSKVCGVGELGTYPEVV